VKNLQSCLLIGNSRWHWATKKKKEWKFIHSNPDETILTKQLIEPFRWAAVGRVPNTKNLRPEQEFRIDEIPLLNLPRWLGIDRALASWSVFNKANSVNAEFKEYVVIDAGTILSVTKISLNGEFIGGQLAPGLNLQLEAMSWAAEKLNHPGVKNLTSKKYPSQTNEAMQSGSLESIIGIIIQASQTSASPIWLCGGDAPILINHLNEKQIKVIHKPNLVLEGMIHLADKF